MAIGYYFYLILLLLNLIYGAANFRKLTNSFKWLFLMVACTFFIEIASRYFALYHGSSSPGYHILIPIYLFGYTNLYTSIFSQSKLRLIIRIIHVLLIVICLVMSLFVQTLLEFPSFNILLLGLYMVLLTLILFYLMLLQPEETALHRQPVFWMNLGHLLFYGITFLIFGFFKPYLHMTGQFPEWQYWVIRIMNYILYSFYLICFYHSIHHNNAQYSWIKTKSS